MDVMTYYVLSTLWTEVMSREEAAARGEPDLEWNGSLKINESEMSLPTSRFRLKFVVWEEKDDGDDGQSRGTKGNSVTKHLNSCNS